MMCVINLQHVDTDLSKEQEDVMRSRHIEPSNRLTFEGQESSAASHDANGSVENGGGCS